MSPETTQMFYGFAAFMTCLVMGAFFLSWSVVRKNKRNDNNRTDKGIVTEQEQRRPTGRRARASRINDTASVRKQPPKTGTLHRRIGTNPTGNALL